MNEHQNGEGYKVDSNECLRQALVISRESTKAVQPAEATFHRPATGQQHKALFRFRQLDHPKLDSFIQRCLRGLLAGTALIGKRYLDRLACGLLDLTRKPASCSFAGVICTTSNCPNVSTSMWTLLPRLRL